MLVGRVVGTVVSTQKHPKIAGAKLLLVQPTTPSGEDAGPTLLAVDSVGAGPGERVLVVLEGKSAVQAHGVPLTPIDAAIVGIVDHIDTP